MIRRRNQKGLSFIELITTAGLMSVVALAASGILANLQRVSNRDKIRRTQLDIARTISNTLKDGEALLRTAQVPTYNGNQNIRNCLYRGLFSNPVDCRQVPYSRVIDTNINPIDLDIDLVNNADPNTNSPPNENGFNTNPQAEQNSLTGNGPIYQFELLNAAGEKIHPPGIARWTPDGVLCDGQLGRPTYTYANRDACPIRSELAYVAACNSNLTQEAQCTQATDLKFVYFVSVQGSSFFGGGTSFPTIDSTSSDPILISVEQLTRTEIVAPGTCDYENGYVMAGVTTDRTMRCVQLASKKNSIARHSLSSQVPNCTFNNVKKSGQSTSTRVTFPKKSDGYSFLGAYSDLRVGTNVNIGGEGSCANVDAVRWDRFVDGITYELNDSLSFTANTDNDMTLWLANMSSNGVTHWSGNTTELITRSTQLSRCSVCEIPGDLSVVHQIHRQSNSVPECPEGWDRLYAGFSFGSFSAHSSGNSSGYSVNQDIGTVGGCFDVPHSEPYNTPFIECHHYGPTNERRCLHLTGNDYSMWFAGRPVSTTERARWYRCSVCYRPRTVGEPGPAIDHTPPQRPGGPIVINPPTTGFEMGN